MPRCLLVFEPPDGGVPAHVLALAKGLERHGWQPVVAGPAEAPAYAEFDRAGVEVIRLPLVRRIDARRYGASIRVLTRLIRSERFDLVHAHSSKAGAIGRIAARLTGTAAVYTPHCFAFMRPGSAAGLAAVALAERRLARRTRAIICVAEHEREVALRHRIAPAKRLHVVHNGAPSCEGAAAADPELGAFAAGGPLVACLSVLRRQKAVDTFIAAAPAVLQAAPNVRLAVIGDGDMRPSLEEQARALGVHGRVRFFDFTPPVYRQLRQLDLFVLPSAWEAFPISVIEAMACGVPQIASDVGGTGEAVVDGETGVLFPATDVGALADAILELVRDPQRRARMAEAGRARHVQLFTIDRMVARTAEVYESVLADGAAL